MQCCKSIILSLLLSGCTSYPVFITPKLDIPETFLSPVKDISKKINLTDKTVNATKLKLDQPQKQWIDKLLYNYYSNYYGLQICNIKIQGLSEAIKDFNKN